MEIKTIVKAQKLSSPYTLCVALFSSAWLKQFCGDVSLTGELS